MRNKTLEFLEVHQSDKSSTFTDDAKWRQENEAPEGDCKPQLQVQPTFILNGIHK